MFDMLSNLLTQEAGARALAVLLDSGAKGVALLALAAGVTLALRRASAASRHLVWTLAMAGLLLLPALSVVVPKWQLPLLPPALGMRPTPSPLRATPETAWTENRVPVPSSTVPATSTPRPPQARPEAASRMFPPEAETASASVPPSAPLASPVPPRRPVAFWALAVWLGVAGAILLPLLAGLAAVARLVRAAYPFADPEWSDRLRDLSAALGVERPLRLLCAGPGAMPMAVGLFLPAILLPQEADAWPEEKRRAVLLHELAHVARRDCLTHALARVALALHWFNPLAWVALRQMRVERERACDDRVLTAGERASTYADHLLDIARTMHAGPLASVAAITMAKQSQLEGRLLAVLDPQRNRRIVTRRILIFSTLLLLSITFSLAALQTGRSTEGDVNEAIGILSRTSLYQKDAPEKLQTVLGLIKQHPQAETLPFLVDDLSSYRKTRRRSAIHIIGELSWDDPAIALKPLRKLMDHSEDLTRGMAALTLSYLQDRDSAQQILKMLQSDSSPYARRCAAFALGELNDPNARQTLETAAVAEEDRVRENAQNALARLKWRKEFEHATGDTEKAARGVWIIAGSVENQAERIGRALELIRAADPVSRAAVLRRARTFDAPDQHFFMGAYGLVTQRIKDGANPQDAPSNYSIKLEENLSVQLLGVAERKWSEYTPWWYPDGTRGAILPDNLKNPSGNPYLEDLEKPTPDEQTYAFAFQIHPQNNRQEGWLFELTAGKTVLDSQSDYKRVSANNWMGTASPGIIGVRLPAETTTCSLRLGVARGEWETVAVCENGKKEFSESSEPSLQLKGIETDNEGSGLVVQYEHRIKDRAFQIVAIRKNGKSLTANRSGVGLNNSPFPFVGFAARPEEIARFEFQTRPCDWVNFHNISLVPDRKTDPHMTVEKAGSEIEKNTEDENSNPGIPIRFLQEQSNVTQDSGTTETVYTWRIDSTETLQVQSQELTYSDDGTWINTVPKGGPPNLTFGWESPIVFSARLHTEGDYWFLETDQGSRSLLIQETGHKGPSGKNGGKRKMEIPGGAHLESRYRREPFTLDNRHYVSLWEGRFVQDSDGKTLYAIHFVAAAAPMSDTGFKSALDLPFGESKDLPIIRLAANSEKPALFSGAGFGPVRETVVQQGYSVEKLIAALESNDINQWSPATTFLAMRKDDDVRPAIPALVRALDHPDKRESALYALREIGPAAREAVPALIRGLGRWSDHPAARWGASVALSNIGEAAAPALQEATSSSNTIVRIWAHAALASNEVQPPDGTTRGDLDSRPHLRTIGEYLGNPDRQVASEALSTVTMLGPKAAPLAPILTEMIKRDDPRSPKSELTEALRRIGPTASPALPEIIKQIDSNDPSLQLEAVRAVKAIGGEDARTALPSLIRILQTNAPSGTFAAEMQPMIRAEAATTLGSMKSAAGEALLELRKLLQDPDEMVRAAAVQAIASIAPNDPQSLANLIQAMQDPSFRVSYPANEALAETGPVNIEVIRAFIEAVRKNGDQFSASGDLTGPSGYIVNASTSFFDQIGPEHRYAVPDLADLAHDPRPGVKRVAFQALARIGEVPADLMPTLIDLAQKFENFWVYSVLSSLGSKAAPAAPAMLKMLKRKDPTSRLAMQVLGNVGLPAAKDAIPILEKMTRENPNPGRAEIQIYETLLKLDPASTTALEGLEKIVTNPSAPSFEILYLHKRLYIAGRNPQAHLQALVEALNGSNSESSAVAARLILQVCCEMETRKIALEKILSIQQGADETAKMQACDGLRYVIQNDVRANPQLIPRLLEIVNQPLKTEGNTTRYGQREAVEALGNLGPAAQEALPSLEKLLRDPDPYCRKAASKAIHRIEREIEEYDSSFVKPITDAIARNFILPPDIRENKTCTVRFKILQDGRLVEPQVVEGQGTGVQSLDQLALNAVLQAGSVPPYPPEFSKKPFVYARKTFRFTPDGKESGKTPEEKKPADGKPLELEGGDFPADYLNQIVAALQKRFVLPSYVQANKTCTVRFKILQDGRLVEPQVVEGQGTGIPGLDQLAINAVLQAGPVPPYPPEYSTKPFVQARVNFQFPPSAP